MKLQNLATVCALALLTSCTAYRDYSKEIAKHGIVAFTPPQGNPAKNYDWLKYGPGAIVERSDARYIVPADKLFGDSLPAVARERLSSYYLFATQRYFSGTVDLSGSATANKLKTASASLSGTGYKVIGLQFINPQISSPFGLSEYDDKLSSTRLPRRAKNGLRDQTATVITDTIVADGIVFYVSRGATGSINADAELAAGLKASLKAQGFFVTERGIELHRPVFVAYKPLPKMKKS